MNDTVYDISIVITTCSRAAMLRRALESLFAQVYSEPLRVEMIVVDDRSTDDTLAVLTELQQASPIPLTILHGARKGVAAARNLAAAEARGAWLASFDDDEVTGPHWLETLYRVALAHDAACVGGPTELDLPAGRTLEELGPRARRLLGEVLAEGEPRPYGAGHLPATNNVLLRRDVYESLNGYDVRFTEGGEDTDFFARMAQAGYGMWFVPAASVLHVTPAMRMEAHALKLSAQRFGVLRARQLWLRDRVKGLTKDVVTRVGLTVVRDLPQWVMAKVRRDPIALLDVECSFMVTRGLLRTLVALMRGGESTFLKSMDFRTRHGEREDATELEK